MTADLSSKLAAAREVIASLPSAKWEHFGRGRLFLADSGMIASVREQIPDGIDPDGDDPEAWEIGDAAVEEAGRRAEAVALLVNARAILFDAVDALLIAAAYMENCDPSNGNVHFGVDEGVANWQRDMPKVDAALARLREVLP